MTMQKTYHSIQDTNSTSNNFSNDSSKKYKELNLSISDDLNIFYENVKSLYKDVIYYEKYAESEQFESLGVEDIAGEEIFETFIDKFNLLKHKIINCKEIQESGLEIPDELVNEMQAYYNDIVLLKNYISETYEEVIFKAEEDSNIKTILDKAEDIINDISSTEASDFILQKATDLYEDIKDAELNFPKDKNKLKEAYVKLQDFAETVKKDGLRDQFIESIKSENKSALTQKLEADDELETRPFVRRKTMKIISENDEGNILIKVAKQSEEVIHKNQTEVNNYAVVDRNINNSEKSALAKAENSDPINKAVNKSSGKENGLQRPWKQSLVQEFITDEKHLDLIKDHYGSIESFEKILSITVLKIEESTKDAFERWLDEKKTSPFLYLKGMSISEIEKLVNSPNTREIVKEKNIKYETFLTWIDLMPQMLQLVGDVGDIKFGKLFVLWMIHCNLIK